MLALKQPSSYVAYNLEPQDIESIRDRYIKVLRYLIMILVRHLDASSLQLKGADP